MIDCPYCSTPNRHGSKYCSNCGRRLDTDSGMVCPSCQALNPLGSAYCGVCGTLLAASTLAQEGSGGSEEEGRGPGVATPSHRRLPLWLYPCPDAQSGIPSPSTDVSEPSSARIAPARQGEYLQGVGDVLPRADAWLPSSQRRVTEPTSRPDASGSEGRNSGSR